MLKVGLTGGVGCGKTTISRLFAAKSVPVIDADEVSRSLVLPGQPAFKAIAEHFGDNAVGEQGLDRAWLRQHIFSDPAARTWMEELLHPLVYEHMQCWMDHLNADYCLCVIPLILESGQRNFVDRLLVVDCEPDVQRRRVRLRDGMDDEGVERMMAAQASREARLVVADDVITNNEDSIEGLVDEVDRLHAYYRRLSGAGQA